MPACETARSVGLPSGRQGAVVAYVILEQLGGTAVFAGGRRRRSGNRRAPAGAGG